MLVADSEQGLFAPATDFSRKRVQGVFVDAVTGGRERLATKDAESLGRMVF